MLSWSPRADIEDEERRYFKANVFPEVRLSPPIPLRVLTSLPWTTKHLDLHTKCKGRLRKKRKRKKCSPATEIPRTVNREGRVASQNWSISSD